jgi:hypothetical protein
MAQTVKNGVSKTDVDRLLDAQEIIRRKNNDILALRNNVGRLQREADTADEIRRVIFNLSEHNPEPPAWTHKIGGPSEHRGGPVGMWSDIHYGEVIDPSQVGGVNKFNAAIAKKRMQKLVDTTADLCFNHMGSAHKTYPGIVICLGGDMISGVIHEELAESNDRTPMQAVNDLTDLLAGCIENTATKFGRVFLPCVVGNHGRTTHKPRLKSAVFHSYDWGIYCNLARHFRGTKTIQFMIPNETDARFDVFGHRFLLTHGDNLGVKGGDGIIGAIGPITRGSLKVHASEAEIGRDFDTLLIGHWHQYISLPGLVVNNSVKGYDEYARLRLRAKYSRPSQALFFVHPQHGVTAHWQVYLEPKLNKKEATKTWVEWQS